ncbi:PAS domain S-box protein [Sinorhizobium meliloti]|nr:PAS domain S-box protein [Sinorhizobium meliloti]
MEADDAQITEIRELRACIGDLLGVLALPAVWAGATSARMASMLADVLTDTLHADYVLVRLRDQDHEAPIEAIRASAKWPDEISSEVLNLALPNWLSSLAELRSSDHIQHNGDKLSFICSRIGLQDEFGMVVAGSLRSEFPQPAERLLLKATVNQALICLQDNARIKEQQRRATELDHLVSLRTAELAAINEQLVHEIAERTQIEARLRTEEERLKQSEAQLAEAQKLSLTGSFTWHPLSNQLFLSGEAHRLLHVDHNTLPTFDLLETYIDASDIGRYRDVVDLARTTGQHMDFEFRIRAADGKTRHIHLVARRVRDAPEPSEFVGAIQDITQQRSTERALRDSAQRAQALQEELAHANRVATIGQMSAAISHELRQPLQSVVTSANAALNWLQSEPQNVSAVRRSLQRIVSEGLRAAEILDRTRSQMKKGSPKREVVDLNAVISDTMSLVTAHARLKGVTIHTSLDDRLPLIFVDRIQLQQVILNLMLNAMEAVAAHDWATREVRLISSHQAPNMIRITINDSGPGIAPEHFDRLFDAFFTTKHDGMGLGLAICRNIIEAHDGRLWADADQLGGATFHVSLPLKKPDG